MEEDRQEESQRVPLETNMPTWLWVVYIMLPLWSILMFYIFFKGSVGWLDKGLWAELQKAAGTTFEVFE